VDTFAYSSISHLHSSGQRQGSVGTRRGRGQEFSMSMSASGGSRRTLVHVHVCVWGNGVWHGDEDAGIRWNRRENSACFAQYEANHGFKAD